MAKRQSPAIKNSVLTDDKLGISAIAHAQTIDEIKQAFSNSVSALQNNSEVSQWHEIRELAKREADGETDGLQPSIDTVLHKTAKAHEVKNGNYLRFSVHYQDTDFVDGVRNGLIEEYQAHTPSELLIIDTVCNAYFGYMRASKALKSFVEDNDGRREYESKTWIMMFKELRQLVDMSQRHFTTSLTFLKEFRQPAINLKIQSKNAYISQNQQFNKNA